MTTPLWLSEREVVDLMSLPEAIEALRQGLQEEAAGRAANMVKTHVTWDGGSTLHAIGAVMEGRRVAGAKVWAHTEGGADPLLVIYDAKSGSLLAIIEAFAMGQMRTGGVSGLAADVLAPRDARRMAMIGAGKQSLAQVAAVGAVRELQGVAVWSPTPSKREALAARIEAELGIAASAPATLEEALQGAEIVTLATRARAPFVDARMLSPGAHINAVGAITPERAEFDPAMLDSCTAIAADSPAQVRRLSQEFMTAFGDDEAKWQRLKPLSALLGDGAVSSSGRGFTLFKAMGMGISDLALGVELLDRAHKAGAGAPLAARSRAMPRLVASRRERVI